jgi:hypothetical protein
MTVTGFRPQGSTGPKYNPERDFAYITGTLLKAAIENLDIKALSTEAKHWYEQNNITEAEIISVVDALSKAQNEFVKAYEPVPSLEAALRRHRFYDIRYPVRQFLFAAIGEVMCGAWFTAVREVSNVGFESPAQNDMARFASAARDFCRRLGAPTLDEQVTLDVLRFQNDVLQTQISMLLHQLSEARNMKPCEPKPNGCGSCKKEEKTHSVFERMLIAMGVVLPTEWTGPK